MTALQNINILSQKSPDFLLKNLIATNHFIRSKEIYYKILLVSVMELKVTLLNKVSFLQDLLVNNLKVNLTKKILGNLLDLREI